MAFFPSVVPRLNGIDKCCSNCSADYLLTESATPQEQVVNQPISMLAEKRFSASSEANSCVYQVSEHDYKRPPTGSCSITVSFLRHKSTCTYHISTHTSCAQMYVHPCALTYMDILNWLMSFQRLWIRQIINKMPQTVERRKENPREEHQNENHIFIRSRRSHLFLQKPPPGTALLSAFPSTPMNTRPQKYSG